MASFFARSLGNNSLEAPETTIEFVRDDALEMDVLQQLEASNSHIRHQNDVIKNLLHERKKLWEMVQKMRSKLSYSSNSTFTTDDSGIEYSMVEENRSRSPELRQRCGKEPKANQTRRTSTTTSSATSQGDNRSASPGRGSTASANRRTSTPRVFPIPKSGDNLLSVSSLNTSAKFLYYL